MPVSEAWQIANFADFSNDCGNCDEFCPEDGGPYVAKPRLFVSRERWLRDAPHAAILVERDAMMGRFNGVVVWVGDGEAAADDPRAQVLRRLLDPGEVNYLSEFLRDEAAG